MRICYFCKSAIDEKLEIFRTTECPSCSRELKVCKNCKFYSPGSKWDCHETIDELVADKERSNFCSYFKFSEKSHKGSNNSIKKNTNAKEAFNKLFNDGD